MIAYLSGKILKKNEKGIILKIDAIGYYVFLSKKRLLELNPNSEIELYIHQQIREDASDLYGFETFEELNFFKTLLSINGIGPKVGMEILNLPIEKVSSAIANEDSEYIRQIPGIGQKTAKRIILELKEKIDIANVDIGYKAAAKRISDDIVDALIGLGYQKNRIIRTLKDIPEKLSSEEEIITYFLKHN